MDDEWKRGWPPIDPRVERDWQDRWEIAFAIMGVWHRRKPKSD